MAFRLLGLIEENALAQSRRKLETEEGLGHSSGTWAEHLHRLKQLGMSGTDIAEGLSRIHVEPVLTAHPTEAKRQTVLEHYRELYLLLVKRENAMWTPQEQSAITDELKATLERLWRTGDIFLEKPDLPSELRNIIHYLRNVFPSVLSQLDLRLRQAWIDAGFDVALLSDPTRLPRLTFGNWVGGDRDGHPLVSAEVTRRALDDLRSNALFLLHQQLTGLAIHLSLSDRLSVSPVKLIDRIADLAGSLGESGRQALARNPGEPWRQFVNLMLAKLPIEMTVDRSMRLRKHAALLQRRIGVGARSESASRTSHRGGSDPSRHGRRAAGPQDCSVLRVSPCTDGRTAKQSCSRVGGRATDDRRRLERGGLPRLG